jgi:TetR/AcrR family transcriptional regulator, regulator of cefoperazone and chloramphenicol sensitivity
VTRLRSYAAPARQAPPSGAIPQASAGGKPAEGRPRARSEVGNVKGAPPSGVIDDTRDRLLKAAERLFSERGFKRVTVREICNAARANVAAVNYHFGDKLGLYREVMQSATEVVRATTEAAREAGRGQPPEEQLRRFIVIFLQRLLSSKHDTVHQLFHREMHDPTPALDTIVDQGIRPRIAYLSDIIARMIGCNPSEQAVLRTVASIQAQAISYLPNPIASRLGFPFKPTQARIDEAAKHIATFSIAGVYAVGRSVAASNRSRRLSKS